MNKHKNKYSRTVIFNSHQDPLHLENLEIPELKKKEILIKNEYTTLCRSDLNTFTGKRTEKCPTILGHEIVGRIAAFGQEATRLDFRDCQLQIGDRVTWSIFASNPTSELSRTGIPQKAEGLFKYGHEQLTQNNTLHGGLSQYCILRPNTHIIKIHDSIPLKLAAIINCAGATVAGAIRLAGSVYGKNVAVSGVGMLGIIACAMCKASGAKRIIAMDIYDKRLETARSFGAHDTRLIHESRASATEVDFQAWNNDPIHTAFEFSGSADAMELTLNQLYIGGTVIWVGATHPQRKVCIDAEAIVRHLLTIRGLHNYNEQDLKTAVEFFEKYHVSFPFEQLIEDRFSLEQAQEAFHYALESNHHRVGVRIGESK
jgi:putative phosphonate catabolism associated alcohol dehydrogenase